jgi:hypothetical protein
MGDADFMICIRAVQVCTNKKSKMTASGLHDTRFSLKHWFDFKDSGITRRDCSGEDHGRRIRFSIEQTAFTAFANI